MALTLSDLRDRLKLRTGDPQGDFLDTTEEKRVINDAVRKVASDLYRNGTALLTDRNLMTLQHEVILDQTLSYVYTSVTLMLHVFVLLGLGYL